jgi:hypothetical protein
MWRVNPETFVNSAIFIVTQFVRSMKNDAQFPDQPLAPARHFHLHLRDLKKRLEDTFALRHRPGAKLRRLAHIPRLAGATPIAIEGDLPQILEINQMPIEPRQPRIGTGPFPHIELRTKRQTPCLARARGRCESGVACRAHGHIGEIEGAICQVAQMPGLVRQWG